MGRLSKADKAFKEKAGMTPLELARMIRKRHNEELEKLES